MELRKANIHAQAYHAGLSDKDRSNVQERWINEERCKVINTLEIIYITGKHD